MRYYPLLLDLREKTCLVVGAGAVGTRKIRTLLRAHPGHLFVLDTNPFSRELTGLAACHAELTLKQRAFLSSDLTGVHLVLACTSNRSLNAEIATACKKRNISCNITDDPDAGDVILPSVIERGDLIITLSTSGKSPALCKAIRQDLDCQFGEEYEILLRLLGRIRQTLLPLGRSSDDNARCFSALVHSSLCAAIRDKNIDEITSILGRFLPQELHPSIGALIHDLFPSL